MFRVSHSTCTSHPLSSLFKRFTGSQYCSPLPMFRFGMFVSLNVVTLQLRVENSGRGRARSWTWGVGVGTGYSYKFSCVGRQIRNKFEVPSIAKEAEVRTMPQTYDCDCSIFFSTNHGRGSMVGSGQNGMGRKMDRARARNCGSRRGARSS